MNLSIYFVRGLITGIMMWKNIKNGHLFGIQRNMMVHLYLSIPIQMIPMAMFLRLSALYKLLRQVEKRVLSTRFFKTFLGGTLLIEWILVKPER